METHITSFELMPQKTHTITALAMAAAPGAFPVLRDFGTASCFSCTAWQLGLDRAQATSLHKLCVTVILVFTFREELGILNLMKLHIELFSDTTHYTHAKYVQCTCACSVLRPTIYNIRYK